eukprot:g32559.t1
MNRSLRSIWIFDNPLQHEVNADDYRGRQLPAMIDSVIGRRRPPGQPLILMQSPAASDHMPVGIVPKFTYNIINIRCPCLFPPPPNSQHSRLRPVTRGAAAPR